MTEKKRTDWEAVERDYRAGILSNREIAERHGCSEGMVRKKAKNSVPPWERDLGAKIRQKADDLVRKQVAAKEMTPEKVATEREIIETNAQAIVSVRMSHRTDIASAKTLVMELLGEVVHQTRHKDLYEQLGDLLRQPDENGNDKLNDLYHKIIDRDGRVKSTKLLTDSLKTLIGLEREAWSIGEDKERPDDLTNLSEEELDTKIADLYERQQSARAR